MYSKVCQKFDPDVSGQNVAEDLKFGIECIETIESVKTIKTLETEENSWTSKTSENDKNPVKSM